MTNTEYTEDQVSKMLKTSVTSAIKYLETDIGKITDESSKRKMSMKNSLIANLETIKNINISEIAKKKNIMTISGCHQFYVQNMDVTYPDLIEMAK